MELSKEQQIAFDKYKNNDNIFISGPGGTGKTALIKKIYEHEIKRRPYLSLEKFLNSLVYLILESIYLKAYLIAILS